MVNQKTIPNTTMPTTTCQLIMAFFTKKKFKRKDNSILHTNLPILQKERVFTAISAFLALTRTINVNFQFPSLNLQTGQKKLKKLVLRIFRSFRSFSILSEFVLKNRQLQPYPSYLIRYKTHRSQKDSWHKGQQQGFIINNKLEGHDCVMVGTPAYFAIGRVQPMYRS